jgi:hypothetical protein
VTDGAEARGIRSAVALGVLLLPLVAGAGCSRDDRRPSAGAPADSAEPGRSVGSPDSATPAAWYDRTRTIDLSGDGRPDRVRLEAVGSLPESLRVILTIHVDGEEKLREAWTSADELAHLDLPARSPGEVESTVRTRLDRVLESVTPHRLGAPGLRLMAEDSTALAGLAPRPTDGVVFSYGFETTVRLAWDAPGRRYVRLFTCC